MPRWFLLTLLAVLCWGIWAVLSKLIGESLTAGQSQALSTLGLLPVMFALRRSAASPSTGRRTYGVITGFLAGMLTCGGNVAYYHALNLGGKISTVVPLTALYPLVTVVLAVIVLSERLSAIQWIGMVLSIAAIYLFNVTTLEGPGEGWLLCVVVPIGLWGLSGFLQKLSTNHVSGELSAFWFLAAFVPVSLGLLFFQPLAGPVALKIWLLAAGLGLFFSLGNFAILLAFSKGGKAAIIAPLCGLYPLVSVPIAVIAMGETISRREMIGIALALLSVAALSFERSFITQPPV